MIDFYNKNVIQKAAIYQGENYLDVVIRKAPKWRGAKHRVKRHKLTSPGQRSLNCRRGAEYCRMLIKSNFAAGDYFVGLSFDDSNLPGDSKAAKRKFANYVARLRRRCPHPGRLKYLAIQEKGKHGGRVHYHVFINKASGLTFQNIIDCWGQGFVDVREISNTDRQGIEGGGLRGVALYVTKDFYNAEDLDNGLFPVAEGVTSGRRWCSSKNLEKPEMVAGSMSDKRYNKLCQHSEGSPIWAAVFEKQYKAYNIMQVTKEYNPLNGSYSIRVEMVRRRQKKKPTFCPVCVSG